MAITTTPDVGDAWAPHQVATFNADDSVSRALILRCATRCGEVEGDAPSVLVPWIRSDPAANVVAEGAEITQTEAEFDQVAVTTRKVATLSQVSYEMTQQPGAATRLAQSMQRSLVAKADQVFMDSADPVGLLHVDGITAGGALEDNLDALADAVAEVEAAGGSADVLLVHPKDWAVLAKLKRATGSNESLLGDAHDAPERSLSGVPVIVHAAATQGTALLLDRSEIVSAIGDVRLARSEDAAFNQDAVAIRGTWRFGFNVIRPDRLVSLTVGAGD